VVSTRGHFRGRGCCWRSTCIALGVRIASTAASLGLVLFSPAPARPSLTSFLDVLTSTSQEEAPANDSIEYGTQTNGETSSASLASSLQDETALPSATDDESAEGTAKFPMVNGPPSSAAQESSGQENGGQADSASIAAVSGDSSRAAPNGPGVPTRTTVPISSSSALSSPQAGTADNSDQKTVLNLPVKEISAFAPLNPGATLNAGSIATSLPQGIQRGRAPISVPGNRSASGVGTVAPAAQEKTVTAQKAGESANGRGIKSESPAVVTGARSQAASAANVLISSAPVISTLPTQLFKQAGPSGNSFQSVLTGASKQGVPGDRFANPDTKTNSESSAVTRLASVKGEAALSSVVHGESIAGAAVALPIDQDSIAPKGKPSAPQIIQVFGGISSTAVNGEQRRASYVATDPGSSSQAVATVSSSQPLAWSATTVDAPAGVVVDAPEAGTATSTLMPIGAMPYADGAKVVASPQTGVSSLSAQLPVQGSTTGIGSGQIVTSAPWEEVFESSFAVPGAKTISDEKSGVISAPQATSGDPSQLLAQSTTPVETPGQMAPDARQNETPASTPTIAEATTVSKLASMLQSAVPAASGSKSVPARQADPSVRAFQLAVPATWQTAVSDNVLTAISVKPAIAASVPAYSPETVPSSAPSWQAQAITSSGTFEGTPASATEEAVSVNTAVQAQFKSSVVGSAATEQKATPPHSVATNGSVLGVGGFSPVEKGSSSVQGSAVHQGSVQIKDGSSGVAEVAVSRAAVETATVQTPLPATVFVASANSDSNGTAPSETAELTPASTPEQAPASLPQEIPVNTPAATRARTPGPVMVSTLEAQVFGKSLANVDLHGVSNEPTPQTPDRGAIADATSNPQAQAASVASAFSRTVASAPVEETSPRDVVVPAAEASATNGTSDRQQPAIGPSMPENDGLRNADAASPGDRGETLTVQDQNGQDNQLRTSAGPSASVAGTVSVDAVPARRDTPAGFISLQETPDTSMPEQAALATKPLNQTDPANAAVAAQPASVVAQPSVLAAKPVAVGDRPALVAVQAAAVAAPSEVVVDEPATFADQPTAVGGKPAAVVPQPLALAAEPAAVGDKPATIADPLPAISDKIATIAAQPAAVADRPVAAASPPAADVTHLADLVAELVAVGDKPATIADPSPAVSDIVATVAAMPAVVADKTAAVVAQPKVPATEFATVVEQPTAVPDDPSAVFDRPAADVAQSVVVADKPNAVIPQHASVADNPSGVVDRHAGVIAQSAVPAAELAPVVAQPAAVVAPPAVGADKPAAVVAQQVALANRPTSAADRPAVVAARPAAVADTPSFSGQLAAVAAKPPVASDQFASFVDQPLTVVAKPAVAVNQPAVVAAQPAAVVAQPTAVADKPSAVAAQPAAVDRKPPVASGQFVSVADQPPTAAARLAVIPEPAVVFAKPSAVVAQPAAVADKSNAVADRPAALAAQPAAVTGKPPVVADQFASVADQPPTAAAKLAVIPEPAVVFAKPSAVMARPAAVNERAAAAAAEPAAFAAVPALDAVQPAVVADQLSTVADKSTADVSQAVAVADKTAAFASQPVAVADKAAAPGASGTKLDNQPRNAAPSADGIFVAPATLPMAAAHSSSENANQPVSNSTQKATPDASRSRNPIVANTGNAVTGKAGDGASGSSAMPHSSQSNTQSSQTTQADPSHTADAASRTADNAAPQAQAPAQTLTQAQAQTIPVPAASAAAPAQRGPDVPETTARIGEQQGVPAPMHSDGSEAVATSSVNTAKLMQTMGESEMHVRMRSSEFGDISIRTTITQEQMVARISLDHGDLSQAISAHVSTMQAKLGEDFGLNASIEVHNLGSQLSGEQGQSSQREQGAFNQSAQTGRAQLAPEEEAGLIPAALTNAGNGNRLDIRA
jgi:hypothetical protein